MLHLYLFKAFGGEEKRDERHGDERLIELLTSMHQRFVFTLLTILLLSSSGSRGRLCKLKKSRFPHTEAEHHESRDENL